MCRQVNAGLLLIVALVLTPAHARAGIDKVYIKPQSEKNWGEVLADFIGYRGYQKSYALVVGISAYSGGYRRLPTQNDPLRMRDFLLNEAGFDYVHVITDEKVTYPRLRTLMEEDFPERVDGNDRFLFYWSGHGTQRELPDGGRRGYLPLASSSPGRFGTMIHMGDIERWDRNIAAEQAMYLVDACFSGLAGVVTQSDPNRRALTIEQLAQPSRHLMVAGTGEEQTIAGDRWGGSIFTDSVLKGLRGEADAASAYDRDGLVSLNELIDYVKKRVSFEKRRAGWTKAITPQLSDLRTNVGEFFFLTDREKIARVERRGEQTTGEFKYGMPVIVMSSSTPAEAPSQGRLTVRSNVFNDSVYINGEYKGSTPLDLDLTPGEYRVRVSKPDYEDWEKIIDLQAGAEEVLWAKLERLSKPSITSHTEVERPSAARRQPKEAWRDPVTGMEFAWVPEGCFQMGSNEGESEEKPVHEVCVDGFWMGKYEVTQGQWKKVMENNPSHFKQGDNHPVEWVSWGDAQDFARKLNAKQNSDFRLPTEAEWEYACRSGGNQERYCGGNDVNRVAWYDKNSGRKTHPVGKKAANGLSLYDMSGNVWEWVSDRYNRHDRSYYGNSPRNSPKGPHEGSRRVIRGGSWGNDAEDCRSAIRAGGEPGYRILNLGFRLARTHP
jgi:formylglycine-generating enzyme required for sulfatase activity